jgi:hypothetical protein
MKLITAEIDLTGSSMERHDLNSEDLQVNSRRPKKGSAQIPSAFSVTTFERVEIFEHAFAQF